MYELLNYKNKRNLYKKISYVYNNIKNNNKLT